MKISYAASLVLALSTLAGGSAFAGDHGGRGYLDIEPSSISSFVSTKSRADVLAELAEAQRTGDLVVQTGGHGAGMKLNEIFPGQYPAKPVVQSKTRAQVLAELAEAQSSGEIVATVRGGHSAQ